MKDIIYNLLILVFLNLVFWMFLYPIMISKLMGVIVLILFSGIIIHNVYVIIKELKRPKEYDVNLADLEEDDGSESGTKQN